MEHVATLAHVVTIREHRFDVTLMAQATAICQKNRVKFNNRFVVAGTQQLDSTREVLEKWRPIAFAQKDKSHGGTNENHWKWAGSFQWRHNASITGSILEELPACLWQS